MKLFEYQAKAVFKKFDIPVPASVRIGSASEIVQAVAEVGFPCVLKAQVLSGGRGKAGLIKLVSSPEEAPFAAEDLFRRMKGPEPSVLVEKAVPVKQELYVSFTIDPVTGGALLLASASGGIDIEELSRTDPDKIIRMPIDIIRGIQPYQVNDLTFRLGIRGDLLKKANRLILSLYKVFVSYDAQLCEINPLFLTEDDVIAGDAKLIIDDNSEYRHPEFARGREYYTSDMQYEAAQEGIPYIEFGGNISLMCAGAGLANTVFDLVHDEGGSIANYLEFGGPNYQKAGIAMRLCIQNHPKVILIVTFGTIARADIMAEGIAEAIRELHPSCPIVACLRGTGEEKVTEIFNSVGLTRYTDTEAAVRDAVSIAKDGVL